jgi:hypothetical protein
LFRKTETPCEYVLDNRTNNIYRLDQTREKIVTKVPIGRVLDVD